MKRCMVLLSVLAIAVVAVGAEKNTNRAAPEKKGGSTASANAKGTGEKAADLDLNGLWRGYVVEGKGEQPNRGSVHLELVIKGNQIVSQRLDGQGGPLGQGIYKITTTDKVYEMDAKEATKGKGKPRTYMGIVRFGPDLMKWCVATTGNPRPTDFETKGKQFLLILKRQKQ